MENTSGQICRVPTSHWGPDGSVVIRLMEFRSWQWHRVITGIYEFTATTKVDLFYFVIDRGIEYLLRKMACQRIVDPELLSVSADNELNSPGLHNTRCASVIEAFALRGT